ncbi:MAG TPA: hypothetical protein VMT24_14825, partial [Aggregatilineaceae bacterium]|nr:hypothetical protein [Aggregatilineaceae bacterium]
AQETGLIPNEFSYFCRRCFRSQFQCPIRPLIIQEEPNRGVNERTIPQHKFKEALFRPIGECNCVSVGLQPTPKKGRERPFYRRVWRWINLNFRFRPAAFDPFRQYIGIDLKFDLDIPFPSCPVLGFVW